MAVLPRRIDSPDVRSCIDMLLSIQEESHGQRSRTDQRQDSHLPFTGQNPCEAAGHFNLIEADEVSADELGLEEWTDRRRDTGITGGCWGMLRISALLSTQQPSDHPPSTDSSSTERDDSDSHTASLNPYSKPVNNLEYPNT